jgi:hypothetical protein
MISKKVLSIAMAAGFAAAIWSGSVMAGEEPKGDVYTLTNCPISGKPLGDAPVVKTIAGRELRFCCGGCPAKAEADPAKVIAKVDAEMIAAQKANYPLDHCAVMADDKLEDGKSADIIYKNRLVRFCCKDCNAEFQKDPAKYLAMLDKAAVEKQKPAYAAKVCPVSGKELGEGAVDFVVANKLVRLCCDGCKKEVEKNPAKFLSPSSSAAAPAAAPAPATPAGRVAEKKADKAS